MLRPLSRVVCHYSRASKSMCLCVCAPLHIRDLSHPPITLLNSERLPRTLRSLPHTKRRFQRPKYTVPPRTRLSRTDGLRRQCPRRAVAHRATNTLVRARTCNRRCRRQRPSFEVIDLLVVKVVLLQQLQESLRCLLARSFACQTEDDPAVAPRVLGLDVANDTDVSRIRTWVAVFDGDVVDEFDVAALRQCREEYHAYLVRCTP